MFGKKPGKMYNLHWYQSYTQIFLPCFSNTTPLIQNCSQWKVTNSDQLMLVHRWGNVNALVQNKLSSTIHLLSQHLPVQSRRWKHQMNVWNLLKVNNKDTRLMSVTSFWCLYCFYCYLWTCEISAGWTELATVPKNHGIALLLFVRNVWFIVVRGEIRTCGTSKIDLLTKIVYSLKSLKF